MKYSLNLGALKSTLPRGRRAGRMFFVWRCWAIFPGRASSGQLATGAELAKRKPLAVDVDNLDDIGEAAEYQAHAADR